MTIHFWQQVLYIQRRHFRSEAGWAHTLELYIPSPWFTRDVWFYFFGALTGTGGTFAWNDLVTKIMIVSESKQANYIHSQPTSTVKLTTTNTINHIHTPTSQPQQTNPARSKHLPYVTLACIIGQQQQQPHTKKKVRVRPSVSARSEFQTQPSDKHNPPPKHVDHAAPSRQAPVPPPHQLVIDSSNATCRTKKRAGQIAAAEGDAQRMG